MNLVLKEKGANIASNNYNEMIEFIQDNVFSILMPLATAFAGWFFGRKRQKAETKVVEGDALKVMQSTYTKFSDDMNEKYDYLTRKIESQSEKIKRQSEKITTLVKRVKELEHENGKLKGDNYEG